MRPIALLLALIVVAAAAEPAKATAPAIGVPISYALPTDGPLPRTYRVTLAIVEEKDPDWIVSTFIRGEARTVTAANKGRFTETWDGLDENLMPVPPGTYGVKGIVMPSQRWAADGQEHTLIPRYLGGPCSFLPVDDTQKPIVQGDPVASPLGDIAVPPDWSGRAVFQWQYLENGVNPFIVDLAKPVGYDQLVAAFPSGGNGGGAASCTDGADVWCFCGDGNIPFVYRTDLKPFGSGHGHVRGNVWVTEGAIGGLACWREMGAASSTVYVAMGAKLKTKDGVVTREPEEKERIDVVVALDGNDARELGRFALARPIALEAHEGTLYALHGVDGGHEISSVALEGGLPKGAWKRVVRLAGIANPSDAARDSRGRWYVCDPDADQVYLLDAKGGIAKRFGAKAKPSGAYDPSSFIAPIRVVCWKDDQGADRLIVNENAGPNRVSEWSPEGKLLRSWTTLHAHCNSGVGIDPDQPGHVYITGAGGWLTRLRCDFAKRSYEIDAAWPVGGDGSQPYMARWKGGTYLAYGQGLRIYRIDGYECRAAGGLITVDGKAVRWHDADGDGAVDAAETTPNALPAGANAPFWGQTWSGDLSLLAIGLGTADVWRLRPREADARGNPVFGEWEKLLTDPNFAARVAGTATPTRGGNEIANDFSSDWSRVQTTPDGDAYVLARGGGGFGANHGTQQKLTRYVSDGAGGLKAKWRVGRAALTGSAGEITGSIHLWPPAHGLVGFADQTRGGYHVYTTDGLFVETMFLDGSRQYDSVYGICGEFFAGQHFIDRRDDRVYLAMGKATPVFFAADGWSKDHGIKPLAVKTAKVSITAAQTAFPPEIALVVRGGAGVGNAARVLPAAGGAPALDGGEQGWESAAPIALAHSGESVEMRLLYDPETLYVRIALSLDQPFAAQPLAPLDGCFIHDRGASTVSLYLQGDPLAGPGEPGGRTGDVRIVFGVFDDAGTTRPVALGLFPDYTGKNAKATVYGSPVGRVEFAHVGELAGAKLAHRLDDGGKRVIIAAAIPRAALPKQLPAFAGLRTMLDVEATLRGHKKFWWSGGALANRDTNDAPSEARLYPAAWAKAEFVPLDRLPLRVWQVCGPFGGPAAMAYDWDLGGKMKDECNAHFANTAFPPDGGKPDLTAVFSGDDVQGYWGDPGLVRWQTRMAAVGDDRLVMAMAGQVWYAALWLHVPEATTIDGRFLGHHQTTANWLLNGEPLGDGTHANDDPPSRVVSLELEAGWNELFMRSHCVGYPPFRFGVVLEGDPVKLWKVRSSLTPPP